MRIPDRRGHVAASKTHRLDRPTITFCAHFSLGHLTKFTEEEASTGEAFSKNEVCNATRFDSQRIHFNPLQWSVAKCSGS